MVKCVVADAGYDSEENHRLAWLGMNVCSIIPPRSGRPTTKPPPKDQPLRRRMHRYFKKKREQALYGQRWQIETNLRHLKQTMKMDVLHCETEEGVLKELTTFALVYNLVRAVMLAAAARQAVPVDRISFADALG